MLKFRRRKRALENIHLDVWRLVTVFGCRPRACRPKRLLLFPLRLAGTLGELAENSLAARLTGAFGFGASSRGHEMKIMERTDLDYLNVCPCDCCGKLSHMGSFWFGVALAFIASAFMRHYVANAPTGRWGVADAFAISS